MKNRRVEIRMTDRDYQLLVSSIPSDFENLSEFVRGATLYIAKHPEVLSGESSPINVDSKLEEIRDILLQEILKNRTLIENLIHGIHGSKSQESRKMKELLIQDLQEWYMSNQSILQTFDDLYDRVSDPFLREVVGDTIQMMKRRGIISVNPAGKVIWHE